MVVLQRWYGVWYATVECSTVECGAIVVGYGGNHTPDTLVVLGSCKSSDPQSHPTLLVASSGTLPHTR
jgi:hypothetical protein